MNKFLNKLSYAYIEFSKYKKVIRKSKKIKYHDFLKKLEISQDYNPVFFLSTGRTGTFFITKILENDSKVFVNHSQSPELISESKFCYDDYTTSIEKMSSEAAKTLLLLARGEILFEAEAHHMSYFETNNKITFFAHIIKDVIPNAKFVHLVRHPGDFIRSGIRRGWYSGEHNFDYGRITPNNNSDLENWDSLLKEEKVAWLWFETNNYIEKVLTSIEPTRYRQVNFSDINRDSLIGLLTFCGLKSDTTFIEKALKTPLNVQTENTFPHYLQWSDEMKIRLTNMCDPLLSQYEYSFYI